MKLYFAGGEALNTSRQQGLLSAGVKRRLISFITGLTKINNIHKDINTWDGKLNQPNPIDIEAEIKALEDMEPGTIGEQHAINEQILSEPKPPVLNRKIYKKAKSCAECINWNSPIGLYYKLWGYCAKAKEEVRHDSCCDSPGLRKYVYKL